MSEQRTRPNMYYLERIKGPVLLHADGSIGELANTEMEVTVREPGRIEGKDRVSVQTQSRLAEIAVHASLADYLDHERNKRQIDRWQGSDYGWTLDDMPPATFAAYEEWKNNASVPDIDAIREQALSRIVSAGERQSKVTSCQGCDRYACSHGGEVYLYPLAEAAPFDVAEAVRLNPEALTIETRPEFNFNGRLSAKRVLNLQGYLEIATDYWSEDGQGRRLFNIDESEIDLDRLQNGVAQKYHERKRVQDYDELLLQLRSKLGRRGLMLAYEYWQGGSFNDPEARFMAAKRVGEQIVTQTMTYSDDEQKGIEDALEFLESRGI